MNAPCRYPTARPQGHATPRARARLVALSAMARRGLDRGLAPPARQGGEARGDHRGPRRSSRPATHRCNDGASEQRPAGAGGDPPARSAGSARATGLALLAAPAEEDLPVAVHEDATRGLRAVGRRAGNKHESSATVVRGDRRHDLVAFDLEHLAGLRARVASSAAGGDQEHGDQRQASQRHSALNVPTKSSRRQQAAERV
jgi:hypothetical protein